MKTGETVRDGAGNSYQLGQLLGRGLWGKSYVVRRESDDSSHVLKCALGPGDFRGDVPDVVLALCREACLETGRLYEQGNLLFLPKLEDRIAMPDGLPALVMPRYAESLERRIQDGMPLGQLLDVLIAVCKQLRQLGASAGGWGVHGDLRPQNVLFNERGDIFLSDLATPAVRRGLPRLAAVAGGAPHLPPEIVEAVGEPGWNAGVDTWSIAAILWRGIQGGDALLDWPRQGLDKKTQVALKDQILERMKQEDSNPRFHTRLAERVAVLLSRALSRETAPSPPFRFPRLDELQTRLEECLSLVRPAVTSVGKVMVDRPASKPWFTTDEEVAYSVTVGCSTGVEGHEEIGVGIAVFDMDRDERLKDLDLGYTVDKHPSGRYKFSFRIGGLGPGRYRGRVAFAIRDSGQQPTTTEIEWNVRAAPGWVPRAETGPPPQPLQLRPETDTVTARNPLPAAEPPAPAPPQPDPGALPVHTSGNTAPGHLPATTPVLRAPKGETQPGAPIPPPSSGHTSPGTPSPALRQTLRRDDAFRDPAVTAVPMLDTSGGPPAIQLPPGQTPVLPPTATPPSRVVAQPPEPRAFPAPIPAAQPLLASAATSATPTAVQVSVERVEPPRPPEPILKPRDWTHEPLPSEGGRLRDLDGEDAPPPPEDDEASGPGLLSRVADQLRNDPYVAVMAGLGLIISVLLVVFLALRN